MKKLFLILIALSLVLTSSCDYIDLNDELYMKIKDEINATFSVFENKTQIAKRHWGETVWFYDHELEAEEIPHDFGRPSIIGSYNKELYFEVIMRSDDGHYTTYIYKCDYYGNNVSEVFCKGGFDTAAHCFSSDYNKGVIYLSSNKKNTLGPNILDYYEIETGKYENIYVSKDLTYFEYIDNIYGENARREEIKNKLTSDLKLAKDMLAASEEGRASLKYNPQLKYPRVAFLNGRIFVSYYHYLKLLRYLDVTFEYDEEQNELKYYCYNLMYEEETITDFYLY